MELSETDLTLLQAVQDLTEREGRPPTFAEIATHIGWQTNSRGTVQRLLDRLRPKYIDWSKSARSLRLTTAGQAILGIAGPAVATLHDQPLSDLLLGLLATGLTQLALIIEQGRPLQSPYPSAWQRALNQMAVDFLLRNLAPLASTSDVIALCKLPFSRWPVRVRDAVLYDEPLLNENEEPTSLCRELAVTRGTNAEAELVENLMLGIRREAQARRSPSAYSVSREFIIRHPVLTEIELMTASFSSEMEGIGGTLHDLYESVPVEVHENGQVFLCGFCGWTLTRRRGRLVCGDDRCRLLTENFTRGTKIIESVSTLQRARSPIRRYIIAPGVYEVRAADRLRSLGIEVEMWPAYDLYDLTIRFSATEIWAVDLKDWRYPHFLAQKLTPLAINETAPWTRAFYVIPDERLRENPSYLTYLQNTTERANFEVLSLSDLIERAHTQLEVSRA